MDACAWLLVTCGKRRRRTVEAVWAVESGRPGRQLVLTGFLLKFRRSCAEFLRSSVIGKHGREKGGVFAYQDVEAADGVAEPGGELGDGGGVGDVEPAEGDGEPARAERRRGGLPARAVPRGEHHGEPVLRQARGEGVPDAPVRARHHGHRLPRPPGPARGGTARSSSLPGDRRGAAARPAAGPEDWNARALDLDERGREG